MTWTWAHLFWLFIMSKNPKILSLFIFWRNENHRIVWLCYRGVATRGGSGCQQSWNFSDQLTLSKPGGGGQIMPNKLLPAPLDSRSYLQTDESSTSKYIFSSIRQFFWLKYGFHKKYFRKSETLTSWTLFSPVFFQISADWLKLQHLQIL